MSSIFVNRSAITALATLRSISNSLDQTSERVSTGLRVSKAADNASNWVVAMTLRSDSRTLGTIADAIGVGMAALDTASVGIEQALKVMDDIKSTLMKSRTLQADKVQINNELDALKKRLTSLVVASSFNNENWLHSSAAAPAGVKYMVSTYTRDLSGAAQMNAMQLDTRTTTLIDTNTAANGWLTKGLEVSQLTGATTATTTANYFLIGGISTTSVAVYTKPGVPTPITPKEIKLIATTTDQEIDGMLEALAAMRKGVQTAGTTFGTLQIASKIEDEFLRSLKSEYDKGVSSLVDADMNEESTRLKALQTQQQLSLQALSMANADAEKILILFR